MRELYVYYRIDPRDAASGRAQVEQLFDRLCRRHGGLHARLLTRPPAGDGAAETWMEVYTHPHGIDAQLQAGIQAAAQGVPQARLGERHAEAFHPVFEAPAGAA
jgi:hypothetical protein